MNDFLLALLPKHHSTNYSLSCIQIGYFKKEFFLKKICYFFFPNLHKKNNLNLKMH